jgi:hypothetical protein
MPDRPHIAVARADRYGHPKGADLGALVPGRYDRSVACPHCDRYGHVGENNPGKKVTDEGPVVYPGKSNVTKIS